MRRPEGQEVLSDFLAPRMGEVRCPKAGSGVLCFLLGWGVAPVRRGETEPGKWATSAQGSSLALVVMHMTNT